MLRPHGNGNKKSDCRQSDIGKQRLFGQVCILFSFGLSFFKGALSARARRKKPILALVVAPDMNPLTRFHMPRIASDMMHLHVVHHPIVTMVGMRSRKRRYGREGEEQNSQDCLLEHNSFLCFALYGFLPPGANWRRHGKHGYNLYRAVTYTKNSHRQRYRMAATVKLHAPGGIRTPGPQFRRLMLYPLSYRRAKATQERARS